MSARRGFLLLVAVLAPAAGRAGAQSHGRLWRIGYLVLNSLVDPPSPERSV